MSARVTTVRRRFLGLAFFMVLALFLALTVLQYNKAFTKVVKINLLTDSAGNALPANADVKIRGLIVGEVRSAVAEDGKVKAELAIQPDKVDLIPPSTTARILPKTLFGERYVSLIVPEGAMGSVSEGATIIQDKSGNALEVSRVLDSLLPLLQAIPPQDLKATLSALGQALGGKGEALGKSIDDLNNIFSQVNANLPTLQEDIRLFADFAQTYSEAAPDLISALSDLTVTGNTVVEKKEEISTFFTSLTSASAKTADLLADNRDSLISIAADSRETLETLARYSPSFGCTFKNFAEAEKYASPSILGVGTKNPGIRVTIELVNTRGRYLPNQDEPRFFDDRGPACYERPTPEKNFPQYPGGSLGDGSYQPPSRNPGGPVEEFTAPQYSVIPKADGGFSYSFAGTELEKATLASIYGQAMGVDPRTVPSWVTLIGAPAMRGAQVSVK
ncbi:MAG: MCE family protein [Mycobacteriaceae bacterium]